MSPQHYDELYVPPEGGYVSLHVDTNDHQVHIPWTKVVCWETNWTVQGGLITIRVSPLSTYKVLFDPDDAGVACATALADLDRMMKGPGP